MTAYYWCYIFAVLIVFSRTDWCADFVFTFQYFILILLLFLYFCFTIVVSFVIISWSFYVNLHYIQLIAPTDNVPFVMRHRGVILHYTFALFHGWHLLYKNCITINISWYLWLPCPLFVFESVCSCAFFRRTFTLIARFRCIVLNHNAKHLLYLFYIPNAPYTCGGEGNFNCRSTCFPLIAWKDVFEPSSNLYSTLYAPRLIWRGNVGLHLRFENVTEIYQH